MSNILPNLLSLLVAATLLLAGCSQQSPMEDAQNAAKAAYRKQAFDECMHELPAGPRTTHYNDWSEVVDACDNASYYITNTRYP